ncbi:MAG: hypothetical protein KIT68_13605 [Phycisphaeraceae bacterium]|nr:hypothetical protein [Phycisphaeraceae bacterium]
MTWPLLLLLLVMSMLVAIAGAPLEALTVPLVVIAVLALAVWGLARFAGLQNRDDHHDGRDR